MGLGRDGTSHGTYESRSYLFPLGRPVSRKACKNKNKTIHLIKAGPFFKKPNAPDKTITRMSFVSDAYRLRFGNNTEYCIGTIKTNPKIYSKACVEEKRIVVSLFNF